MRMGAVAWGPLTHLCSWDPRYCLTISVWKSNCIVHRDFYYWSILSAQDQQSCVACSCMTPLDMPVFKLLKQDSLLAACLSKGSLLSLNSTLYPPHPPPSLSLPLPIPAPQYHYPSPSFLTPSTTTPTLLTPTYPYPSQPLLTPTIPSYPSLPLPSPFPPTSFVPPPYYSYALPYLPIHSISPPYPISYIIKNFSHSENMRANLCTCQKDSDGIKWYYI